MEIVRPSRQTLDGSSDAFSCPKCHAANRADAPSCQACGIVFSRFYAQIEDRLEADFRLAGLSALSDLWQDVLADYENLAVHRKFVETCAEGGYLEFAAARYRRLNNVVRDEIAEAQLKQIEGLAQYMFETAALPTASFTLPRYHLWFFVLAGFFLGVGLFGGHEFRLVGIGALIFLGGLWAFRLASDYRY